MSEVNVAAQPFIKSGRIKLSSQSLKGVHFISGQFMKRKKESVIKKRSQMALSPLHREVHTIVTLALQISAKSITQPDVAVSHQR